MVVNSRMTVSLEMEMDTVSVTVSWVEETLGLTKTKGSKVSTGKKDKLNPSSFQIQNSKYKVGVMDDGLFEEQEREEVSLRKDRGFDQNRRKKEGGCVKREGHSNCKIGKWAISISQIGKGKMKGKGESSHQKMEVGINLERMIKEEGSQDFNLQKEVRSKGTEMREISDSSSRSNEEEVVVIPSLVPAMKRKGRNCCHSSKIHGMQIRRSKSLDVSTQSEILRVRKMGR
ncbi:hypothetical protein QYF36_019414 [Acer negundo]|nr:hypothetical protein QYF36_019414 [Acer negundo]